MLSLGARTLVSPPTQGRREVDLRMQLPLPASKVAGKQLSRFHAIHQVVLLLNARHNHRAICLSATDCLLSGYGVYIALRAQDRSDHRFLDVDLSGQSCSFIHP